MKRSLLHSMSTSAIIGDGAMGTYLYQMGIPIGLSYEEQNVSKPEMVLKIHQEYVNAGANSIQTNTYSAQREKLLKYGLDDQVETINRSAVRLAKQAAGEHVFVLGTVGSILGGYKRSVSSQLLQFNYQEQMEFLLDESIDGIVLETFYQLEELHMALQIARKLTDLPIICQLAIEDIGCLQDGTQLELAFQSLLDLGADVVGLNCRSGPQHMIRSFEQLSPTFSGRLTAFPNAGLPAYIDGEYVYVSTPEYFGKSAKELIRLGVNMIGGCCGTTPEHIRSIASALSEIKDQQFYESDNRNQNRITQYESHTEDTTVEKNVEKNDSVVRIEILQPTSEKKLHFQNGNEQGSSDNPTLPELAMIRKTVIVELDPPKSLQTKKFIEGAIALKEAGIDALTMADNSLAMTRMSNMALGVLVKNQVGIRPLIHIACRDRNLIGQQSHLMGLHALGIDHVLAITGDPSRFGDFPGATSVYDLSSFDLLAMIQQMNQGYSYSGKPLQGSSKFTVATAFNPNIRFMDKAVKRLERKIANGAHYVLTQPVYDHRLIEQINEVTQHLNVPIFLGIMPLTSKRNADFLHNEVPGISLTDDVLRRMEKYEGDDSRKQGLEIAMELLETSLRYFNGVYLMTPFMRYEMTVELTRFVLQHQKVSNKTVM